MRNIVEEIEATGLKSVVIDENTDFNSSEFVELANRMQDKKMKTKQELYEEARMLIASIASNEPRELKVSSLTRARCTSIKNATRFYEEANEIRNAFFDLENNTTQEPCKFAELAVHTRCDAFLNEQSHFPFEQIENINKLDGAFLKPDEYFKGRMINGTYHFVNESVADLKLVCEDFDRRGLKYFVFWNEGESRINHAEYVIWTPELKFD